MIETMMQKAEREADEAQTKLVHARAVLAAYPNATESDGRFFAAKVDVVGMVWSPEHGARGAFRFYAEVPTERGPARVYDYIGLSPEDFDTLGQALCAVARECHAAALAAQLRREEGKLAEERGVLHGTMVHAYLTVDGMVTTDPTKADPRRPASVGEIQRSLPEQRHTPSIDPNATTA